MTKEYKIIVTEREESTLQEIGSIRQCSPTGYLEDLVARDLKAQAALLSGPRCEFMGCREPAVYGIDSVSMAKIVRSCSRHLGEQAAFVTHSATVFKMRS